MKRDERLTEVGSQIKGIISEATVKSEVDVLLRSMSNDEPKSPSPLVDLTNLQSPPTTRIPPGVVSVCLQTCRGRKNFAGRLTQKIFTDEERKESNVRGVLGKKSFDTSRMVCLREVCLKEFPISQGETEETVMKEI